MNGPPSVLSETYWVELRSSLTSREVSVNTLCGALGHWEDAAAHVAACLRCPFVNRSCANEGPGSVVLSVVRTLVHEPRIGDSTGYRLLKRNVVGNRSDNELLRVGYQRGCIR